MIEHNEECDRGAPTGLGDVPREGGAIAVPSRKPAPRPASPCDLAKRAFGESAKSREHDDDRNDEVDPAHVRQAKRSP